MGESVQASGQEMSFKEVFYEDEIATEREQAEALKIIFPNEKYENIQEKIKELKANDFPDKFEKRGASFIIGGIVVPALVMAGYAISGVAFGDSPAIVMGILPFLCMIVGFLSGIYNMFKSEDFQNQKDNDLQHYRKQLLNVFFNENVVGEVENLNEKDWQKIKVLENGKVEAHMIRMKIDDKGLENIESVKIVETDQ